MRWEREGRFYSMIGIVIVKKGRMEEEFLYDVENVVGKKENLENVCIGDEEDMEKSRREIVEEVESEDRGRGVIIMKEMLGGKK